MLYCATGAINSSFWPYYATRHGDWSMATGPRIEVPTAYLAFPREIVRPPRSMAEQRLNIQRWTMMASGGHFPALEQPEALAVDIRAFFRSFRAGGTWISRKPPVTGGFEASSLRGYFRDP